MEKGRRRTSLSRTRRLPRCAEIERGLNRNRVAVSERNALVPVGIDGLGVAGGVELGDLFLGEIPADGAEVLAKLFFIACADDDAGDSWPLEEPIQRDLRDGFSGFLGECLEGVHDFVEIFIFNLRAGLGGFVQPGNFGNGASAADFSGQASPAKRAPDERADILIERKRHELPFVFAADERVIDLVADVAGPAVALGNRERLHEVPAGKIGAGDVADFAALDEGVES